MATKYFVENLQAIDAAIDFHQELPGQPGRVKEQIGSPIVRQLRVRYKVAEQGIYPDGCGLHAFDDPSMVR